MDCLPREHGNGHLVTFIREKDQAGNFIAWLPQPLHLTRGFYDVGLLELRCFKVPSATALATVVPEKVNEGTCAAEGNETKCEESSEPAKSMLLTGRADEEPVLFPGIAPPEIGFVQYIYKKKPTLLEMSIEFAKAMEKGSYPIRLGFTYIDDKQALAGWRTLPSAVAGMYYVIPEVLALATGFTRRCFGAGEFNGERTVSIKDLERLEEDRSYNLETVTYPYTQNLISVNRLYRDLVRVRYTHDTLTEFLTYIAERAVTVNCVVKLEMLEDERIKLTYTPGKAGEYLKLPKKLLDILGFVKTDPFTSGEYISEFPYSQPLFSKLAKKHIFVLELGRYLETLVPMEEPRKRDYQSVVATINKSFTEWNYDNLEPEFIVDDGSIFVSNVPQNVYITLPAAVCEYFGIDEDTKFTETIRVPVGDKITSIEMKEQDDQNQRENAISLPPQPASAQEVLVLLDIVTKQNFGN